MTEFSIEGEHRRFKNILIFLSLASSLFLLCSAIGHKTIEQFLQGRRIDFPDFNHLSVNLFHVKRFLFYLTLFFLLLRIGDGVKWRAWAKILLLFFLIADLFGNMGFYGKEKTSDYFKKTKILEMISSDKESFRMFSTAKTIAIETPLLIAEASPLDIFKEKHLPSLNMLYQLHDLWGIDVIRLKRTDELYKIFTSTPSISTTNLLELYGVKYIISVTLLEKEPRFELVYSRLEGLQGKKKDLLKENTVKLYRNRDPLPRALLVKDFRIMDSKAMLYTMITKKFDPRNVALIEEEPNKPPPSSFSKASPSGRQGGKRGITKKEMNALGDEVKFVSESNNRIDLQVRTKENGLLVLSDTYYPGWKVFINGREEVIYRANYNFRAIPLKPGEHEVKFIYSPISFKIGMFVSLLTLIGIVAYFIRRLRRAAPLH